MTTKFAVIMDSIELIKPHKDTSLALLLEAQRLGWACFYLEQTDLAVVEGQVFGWLRAVKVFDDSVHWFELGEPEFKPLNDLDIIMMRKDPPVDRAYLHTTHLLSMVEQAGTQVFNNPQSLRDFNEKLVALKFPQCCPKTLVSANMDQLKGFISQHQDVILKPLDGMGGASIFRLSKQSHNINVTLELLTQAGHTLIMAQRFIPEISAGDKRIIMINGDPVEQVLARIPASGEVRANLAAGGQGQGVILSERDRWICNEVGPFLREHGILLAGLDVIGDYLTEINITSPTGIRELNRLFDINVAADILAAC